MPNFAFPVVTPVIPYSNMSKQSYSSNAGNKKEDENGKLNSLSPEKSKRLDELNAIIDKGLGSDFEVGLALAEVHEDKLYREFGTFEDYVQKRFGMTRQRAYQLIKAAKAMRELKEMSTAVDISQLPQNEAQVRPLLRLKESKDRAQAWKNALDACAGSKPVSSNVEEAVNALLKKKKKGKKPSLKRKPAVLANGEKIPEALWPNGYVNSEIAQRELDKIKEDSSVPTPVKVKVQKVFLEITKTFNIAADADKSDDMKEGLDFLARDIIRSQQQDDDQGPGLETLKPAA